MATIQTQTQNERNLVFAASDAAMEAAADWMARHGKKIGGAGIDRLVAALRRELKLALPAALEDAREAFESSAANLAGPTFLASMRLAGITAVKSVFTE
jgi:hypothetical protein